MWHIKSEALPEGDEDGGAARARVERMEAVKPNIVFSRIVAEYCFEVSPSGVKAF